MKCIERNEMSCAIKCLVQWNMQWLKQWMNQMKQANEKMNEWNETSQIDLYFSNPCALPALPCFIWVTVLWGQEVREMWVWLKYRCNPDPWMWLAENLVWTAPVSLHSAPGHGQAGKMRINNFPTEQLPFPSFLKYNPSNVQPSFKPCRGGHQGFSQTCLLAATAQYLVPGSAWMHPCCQELSGAPGFCTVEIHSRVLEPCSESFPQVPRNVHQPQISITHSVFVGSIPTVRDLENSIPKAQRETTRQTTE